MYCDGGGIVYCDGGGTVYCDGGGTVYCDGGGTVYTVQGIQHLIIAKFNVYIVVCLLNTYVNLKNFIVIVAV